MSKLIEKLRANKIYNDWGITSKGNPVVSLRPSIPRSVTLACVAVSIKGKKIKGPWYDHGSKTFSYLDKEGRARAYEKAFAWIKDHIGEIEMVKSPFGRYDYVPKEDLERVLATIENGREE